MAMLFVAVRASEMGTAVDVQEVARELGAMAAAPEAKPKPE
jgi:hypothetical protein